MANYRQIHTQIWKDEWFIELDTDEKLLFIYLFSNDNSSLTGIYKISPRVIAFETGLDKETVSAALQKFEADKRAVFRDGIIWIIHMWRYHSNASPKVRTRIENDLSLIHDCPIKAAYIRYQTTNVYDMDTEGIQYPYPIPLTNLILPDLSLSNPILSPEAAIQKQSNIFILYERNIGQIPQLMVDKLKAAETDYPADWIVDAFQAAVNADARNWNYVYKVLENRRKGGGKPRNNNGSKPEKSASEILTEEYMKNGHY